ncbi:MAG: hypothetical protein AAF830_17215, partial [Pseudomonadota bacterium]
MKTKIAAFAASCALALGSAQAMTFSFSVGGFDGGGSITGTFEATDLDMDGQIVSFSGEVTAFEASLVGNSNVADTTWEFADLFGLVYDLDGTIGDGITGGIEGLGVDDGTFEFVHGP